MSLQVPTTQTLADDIVAQLQASLEQMIPILPKAFLRVLAKVMAGSIVVIYKYAGFVFLQLFVAHASMRETTINGRVIRPLVELGRRNGTGDPLAATRAEHTITVTVLSQVGALPAGSQVVHAASGVIHLTTADIPLNAATVAVPIRASSSPGGGDGSGTIGNLTAGTKVQFAAPLSNIAREATVAAQTVTGADEEQEDAYRARVQRREQQRPQGGAYADYRDWGELVAGIVRVWPYTSASPGEVDVYVEATVASSGSADGIPTAPQLAAVASAIELDTEGLPYRRPANAGVNVLPISRTAFNVTVTGLQAADLVAAKAALEDAVDDWLRSREPYIVGLSTLPRKDRVTLASVSGAADDAVSALGGTMATVTLYLGVVVTPAYTLGSGERAKLGTVTYA